MIPAQRILATAARELDPAMLDLVDHLTAEQSCEVAAMLRAEGALQAAELIEARVCAGMLAGIVAMPNAE